MTTQYDNPPTKDPQDESKWLKAGVAAGGATAALTGGGMLAHSLLSQSGMGTPTLSNMNLRRFQMAQAEPSLVRSLLSRPWENANPELAAKNVGWLEGLQAKGADIPASIKASPQRAIMPETAGLTGEEALAASAAGGGRWMGAAKAAAPVIAGTIAGSALTKTGHPTAGRAASAAGQGAAVLPFLARFLPAVIGGGEEGALAGPWGMVAGATLAGLASLAMAHDKPAAAEVPTVGGAPMVPQMDPQEMMAYQAMIQQYMQPYVQNMMDLADQRKADAAQWVDQVPESYGRVLQASIPQVDSLQRQLANSFMTSAQQIPALYSYDQQVKAALQAAASGGGGGFTAGLPGAVGQAPAG